MLAAFTLSVFIWSLHAPLYYYQQYQNSSQNTKHAIVQAQDLIGYDTYLHTLKTEKNTNVNKRYEVSEPQH
jgi:hypothetical protein